MAWYDNKICLPAEHENRSIQLYHTSRRILQISILQGKVLRQGIWNETLPCSLFM